MHRLSMHGHRRTVAVLAPLAVAAAGALTTVSSATVAAAPMAERGVVSAACATGAESGSPEARVREGYKGKDPNDLTQAQALAYDKDLQSRVAKRGLASRATALRMNDKFTTITINVYANVIRKSNGTGGATMTMVEDQIKVLNQAYSGHTDPMTASTPFRFRLKQVTFVNNTNWYNWGDQEEIVAKRKLHKGDMSDLNIYIANLEGGLLGYAYYPQDNVGFQDGVVLLDQSLPGGSAAPYNEGDTATHEVGHWLGLAHTFDNGCSYPGDFVKDTPYQADGDNIFFCRESDDTCKQAGKDPVHNFMSYGDDPCLDQFTEGQGYRMLLSWLSYRDV